jgi:hypothetical protein
MNEPEHDDASEPRIPAKLAAELKALYTPPRPVPMFVDASVLGKAQRFLAQIRELRSVIRLPQALAIAAAVALAVLVGSLLFSSKRPASMAREDVNADGRVDVLDAFALARQLQQGAVLDRQFDFNGDGVVNQRDIDAVANQAVKVEKTGNEG